MALEAQESDKKCQINCEPKCENCTHAALLLGLGYVCNVEYTTVHPNGYCEKYKCRKCNN